MKNVATLCVLTSASAGMITTDVLIDTAMTNRNHQANVRTDVPESEVATIALVAAKDVANSHRIEVRFLAMLASFRDTMTTIHHTPNSTCK